MRGDRPLFSNTPTETGVSVRPSTPSASEAGRLIAEYGLKELSPRGRVTGEAAEVTTLRVVRRRAWSGPQAADSSLRRGERACARSAGVVAVDAMARSAAGWHGGALRVGGATVRTEAARGAAAGAVGVVAMDVVTWVMYRRQSRRDLLQEKRARVFGKDTAHAAVRHVTRAMGSDAGTGEPNGAGIAVHYGLGMGPAAVYAVQRRRWPQLRAGGGALYGFLLFVINDELAAPLLRLAGPPKAYPPTTHVRGLVGHVVLGMATEAALNAIEGPPVPQPAESASTG